MRRKGSRWAYLVWRSFLLLVIAGSESFEQYFIFDSLHDLGEPFLVRISDLVGNEAPVLLGNFWLWSVTIWEVSRFETWMKAREGIWECRRLVDLSVSVEHWEEGLSSEFIPDTVLHFICCCSLVMVSPIEVLYFLYVLSRGSLKVNFIRSYVVLKTCLSPWRKYLIRRIGFYHIFYVLIVSTLEVHKRRRSECHFVKH